MTEAEAPQRARIETGSGEIVIRSRVLPMTVPLRSRPALEIIRFAAVNHLCVDLTYDGSVRRIEPYSLRQTAEWNFVLHALRAHSGEHRSYRIDRMQGATVTAQPFVPRYLVELTTEGPLPVTPSARVHATGARSLLFTKSGAASPALGAALPSAGGQPMSSVARFVARLSTAKQWMAP